jgi:hypothetical protein
MIYFKFKIKNGKGQDSSVGNATLYGLDGPGIKSRWGRDFPHLSRPAVETHSPSYTMCAWSFRGVKQTGRGANHPPHPAPMLKKE